MKKLYTLLSLVALSTLSYSQYVGINTSDPKATLDVAGYPTDATKFDGVIPPRLTGDELSSKTYTTAQTGAIVYATAAASTLSGQVVNVSTPAFYYFDGTVWQALAGKDWHITGNSDTDPSTNFLGTINDKALVFKVNNTWAGYIDNNASTKNNVSLGLNALPNALTTQSSDNTAIGENAMSTYISGVTNKETIGVNVAVGSGAMQNMTKGSFSTAIGSGAMGNANNVWNSTAVGQNALASVTGASNNTAIGGGSQVIVTTGSGNSSLGLTTLSKLTTGGGNIAIGIDAGNSVLTTGSGNILIGVGTTVPDNNGGYINIGNVIKGTGAPSGIYGTITDGVKKVGIATVNMPKSTLEVNGSVAASIRTGSGVLTINDYTVLASGDITLPDATTCPGRIYKIIYNGTNVTVSPTIANNLYFSGIALANYGLNNNDNGRGITVQSNGTSWYVTDRF